jgi:hypothetical protein
MLENYNPKVLVRNGTIAFTACIALAYALYPHWVTLSGFAAQWYTLVPFILAMLIAMFELWYVAARLRKHGGLTAGANALYVSAVSIGLVICIPYARTAIQKDIHDIVARVFALSAALGFALIAKHLQNSVLGALSGTMFGICVLELVFLARYAAHPVQPWVWTVLELVAVASLIAAIDITVKLLEQKTKLHK